MKKLFALLILPLCLMSSVHPQDYDYGKPEEMKGLTKIFIDTDGDMKNRDRITEEVERAKLGVQLLDGADGAEIIVRYVNSKERSAARKTVNVGEAKVLVVKGERLRVVMSFRDEERNVFEKKPANNFGKNFVKAYKKANGLK